MCIRDRCQCFLERIHGFNGHLVVQELSAVAVFSGCLLYTSEGIGGFVLQLFFPSKEITFGQDAVRIQYYQVFTLASFHPVVTGLPGAGVGLVIVMYVQ